MNWIPAGAAGLVVGVATAFAAWRLVRAARDRYRHLLAAVELLGRQATELRREVDRLGERVQTIDHRLERTLGPQVERLARGLDLEQAAERVRRAEGEGRLAPATARRLLEHLLDLGEANAADRPS